MKYSLPQKFNDVYNKTADSAYFSPGRVNLIGEHIDYNGGLVMPCAITFGTYLLISPNNENIFRFRSLNFTDQTDIKIQSDFVKNGEYWYNYPLGVIEHFLKDG